MHNGESFASGPDVSVPMCDIDNVRKHGCLRDGKQKCVASEHIFHPTRGVKYQGLRLGAGFILSPGSVKSWGKTNDMLVEIIPFFDERFVVPDQSMGSLIESLQVYTRRFRADVSVDSLLRCLSEKRVFITELMWKLHMRYLDLDFLMKCHAVS